MTDHPTRQVLRKRELIELTATIAKVTGMRFCTQCNLTRPIDGGKVKMITNGRIRWMCAQCAERKRPAGFGKGKA